LLDELLMIAPTIGLLIFGWWSYYPIDRRIREASLIGRVDAGLPVYPIWTRGQYLLAQVRHQLALILAPLLAILAWQEVVMRMPADWFGRPDYRWLAMIGGALVVFLAAPLIIRFLWDTVPLPPGELRRRLEAMCRRHRVGVRQLLVWRTFGGMINAAVMGLIAPLRYILLTDALLEMVPRPQVEAVMAHELAHVRKHHMFWLAAAAIGSLGTLEITFGTLFMSLTPDPAIHPAMVRAAGPPTWLLSPHATLVATVAAAGVSWILVFGYVSRRFERQADAFAVRHLATEREDPARDAEGRILVDALSAHTMAGALQTVADLNHIPTTRRSWRHGSIRWRQQYLMSLVGRPVDELPIDRRVRHIKFAAGLAIAAIIAIQAWAG
ncbi:MAG: M48 family metallopeptidase, partial [Phycisphaeraceae bacterium]